MIVSVGCPSRARAHPSKESHSEEKRMVVLAVMLLAACDVNDADLASRNVSKAADNFEAQRRFVFYNGITGEFMLEITGLCSKDNSSTGNTLGVIGKTGSNTFKKHMLGPSDNVTGFMEDLSGTNASVNHYRVTFKFSVIIPDIDIR